MKITNAPTIPSIFLQNNLSYVMNSESNIRNYLVEALDIDHMFIDKFSVHDWVSALGKWISRLLSSALYLK
jgi:hypothetical protein